MTDHEWVQAARNRQPVRLVSGDVATLLAWGLPRNHKRARVEFPNGRQRTVQKAQIKTLTEIL